MAVELKRSIDSTELDSESKWVNDVGNIPIEVKGTARMYGGKLVDHISVAVNIGGTTKTVAVTDGKWLFKANPTQGNGLSVSIAADATASYFITDLSVLMRPKFEQGTVAAHDTATVDIPRNHIDIDKPIITIVTTNSSGTYECPAPGQTVAVEVKSEASDSKSGLESVVVYRPDDRIVPAQGTSVWCATVSGLPGQSSTLPSTI